jgi:membrane associated rhomboid family serine protease
MGIYDRDYQRGDDYDRRPGFNLGAPRMMTTNIILVTCALYVLQLVAGPWYTNAFELHADWFRRPWTVYQLLTYGFLHDPTNLWHIVLNMFGLFMFGREVELRYGRIEFLVFYLTAIVVAGLVWTATTIPSAAQAAAGDGIPRALGASGGVVAVVVLFAFNFPFRTVLFMFFLPMPMWVAAAIFVVVDALAAMNVRDAGGVAVTAHLGGALFAFLYYRWGGRLERLLPDRSLLAWLRPRPKLRVHDPDAEEETSTDNRVDEILKKIQEHGQESLTYSERRILEEASREYQRRRR